MELEILRIFGAGIGFATKSKQDSEDELMKSTIQNALKKAFSPEFLNRLDDVVVFNSLNREDIHKIIDITLDSLFERVRSIGYDVELTEKAKDFLAEKGYDPQYGARPLNRAIQRYLEDPVAEEILQGDVKEGDTILADHSGKSDDELTLKIKKKRQSEREENKRRLIYQAPFIGAFLYPITDNPIVRPTFITVLHGFLHISASFFLATCYK